MSYNKAKIQSILNYASTDNILVKFHQKEYYLLLVKTVYQTAIFVCHNSEC